MCKACELNPQTYRQKVNVCVYCYISRVCVKQPFVNIAYYSIFFAYTLFICDPHWYVSCDSTLHQVCMYRAVNLHMTCVPPYEYWLTFVNVHLALGCIKGIDRTVATCVTQYLFILSHNDAYFQLRADVYRTAVFDCHESSHFSKCPFVMPNRPFGESR